MVNGLAVKMRSCRVVLATLLGVVAAVSPALGQDLVRKALEDSSFVWRSSESEGIRIYYQKGSFAEKHRSMLLRSVKIAVDEVQESLGESPLERPFHLFYLDSREEMKRITGRPVFMPRASSDSSATPTAPTLSAGYGATAPATWQSFWGPA